MDLAVFTNGAMRNVSGVTPDTTCAQLVYALAHATQQKGRFVLVAVFGNGSPEYRMIAEEKPYAIVEECEKRDVQVAFELRRLNPSNDVVRDAEQHEADNSTATSAAVFPSASPSSTGSSSLNNGLTGQNSPSAPSANSLNGGPLSSANVAVAAATSNRLRRSHSAEMDGDSGAPHRYPHSRAHSNHHIALSLAQQQRRGECVESVDTGSRGEESMARASSGHATAKEPKRPPPPAYAEVIEQRCNSLTRRNRSSMHLANGNGPTSPNSPAARGTADFGTSAILSMTVADLQTRHFTIDELEALVNAQSRVIATQKSQLLGLELTLSNDAERELVQLRKQHNNLQTVLNSLRNASWQTRVEAERHEAERLHTAIDAMRTAIENKRRELHEALELQQSLERQLVFQNENGDAFQAACAGGTPIYS